MFSFVLAICLAEAVLQTLYYRSHRDIVWTHLFFYAFALSILLLFCSSNIYLAKYSSSGRLLNQFIPLSASAWKSVFLSKCSLATLIRLINTSGQMFVAFNACFQYLFTCNKPRLNWRLWLPMAYGIATSFLFDPDVQRWLYIQCYPSLMSYRQWFQIQALMERAVYLANCGILLWCALRLIRHFLQLPRFSELFISSGFMTICHCTLSVSYAIMFYWTPNALMKYSKLSGITTYLPIDLSMDGSLYETQFYFQAVTVLLLAVALFMQTRYMLNLKGSLRKIVLSKRTIRASSHILMHYVKNEIFAIQSEAELGREGDVEEAKRALCAIEERSKQMWEHLEHVFSSAKSQNFVMRRLKLRPVMEQAAARTQADANDIDISISITPELSVYVDEGSFANVLYSILRNAVEALIPAERAAKRIEVTAEERHAWVDIHIRDNGIGITRDDMKKVFVPFYSSKNKRTNWGLGLSLCQDIIVAHGGRVTLNSVRNAFTDVRIMLPYYVSDEARRNG